MSPSQPVDLDLRHLRCPMPVLLTRKRLAAVQPGTLLRVLCTDPLAGIDIPHLLRQSGDELIEHDIDGVTQVFVIRKA
ncbi:sulfurtransferase TusA family protein [Hyphomicrobiales bacterium BP6-180914]|uniref:Sulfurtransferase TusA family protein n=2 Tax=Lichenifustis flavocetrariae TaxID=2949735 RepID=A0AA41Z263_9HYPH|nr:sulfurtransferase TusA family protein [Lichenifustis flavocetrariae]MCW6509128.1 sulfurtransferase TusA family protein [Lichenifustis flavocetrariae]